MFMKWQNNRGQIMKDINQIGLTVVRGTGKKRKIFSRLVQRDGINRARNQKHFLPISKPKPNPLASTNC